MSKFKNLNDLDLANKIVLLRVDLNVPVHNNKITNNERIIRSLKTIKELVKKNAKVVVLSHLGRPSGNGYEAEFSLKIVADQLQKLLKQDVKFVSDCIGDEVKQVINNMEAGQIAMLENVRFYKEETKNDPEFVAKLAQLGDVFVSDAFSASHRAHASTVGLASKLPALAGRLMEEELNALEQSLESPKRPVAVIVGGAKISTKLSVLHNLIKKSDYIIIAGGMSHTFAYAMGSKIGLSLCEKDMVEECIKIIAEAKNYNCELVLPVDGLSSKSLDDVSAVKIVSSATIEDDDSIFDAGPKSIINFHNIIKQCKTVLWNGPFGVFEKPPFDTATIGIAKFVADLTQKGKLVSVAGGGDTVSALQGADVIDKFTYISTAGGAFLEWMEGKKLPGVECLRK